MHFCREVSEVNITYSCCARKPENPKMFKPFFQARVDAGRVNWTELCVNTHPHAIEVLRKNKSKIDWKALSANESYAAVNLLLENPDKIDFVVFSGNSNSKAVKLLLTQFQHQIDIPMLCSNTDPNAIAYLSQLLAEFKTLSGANIAPLCTNFVTHKFLTKICWGTLSSNPSDEALDLLFANPDKIDLEAMCWNTNPRAIAYVRQQRQLKDVTIIDWKALSTNQSDAAVQMLQENEDNIDWWFICMNRNDKAIEMIASKRQHPARCQWNLLSSNASDIAIRILRANLEHVDLHNLSYNRNEAVVELLEAKMRMMAMNAGVAIDACVLPGPIWGNPHIFEESLDMLMLCDMEL